VPAEEYEVMDDRSEGFEKMVDSALDEVRCVDLEADLVSDEVSDVRS